MIETTVTCDMCGRTKRSYYTDFYINPFYVMVMYDPGCTPSDDTSHKSSHELCFECKCKVIDFVNNHRKEVMGNGREESPDDPVAA